MHEHMSVIFATMATQHMFSVILSKMQARNRLVSYYEIFDRDDADEIIQRYVTLGITQPDYEPRKPIIKWDNESFLSARRMSLINRLEKYNADQSQATD